MTGFGGASILEIRDNYDSDTFRAVYTVRFAERLYVLHVFQKKSRQSIQTAKQDIELIRELSYQTFMQEALQEGRKALPDCLPNPPVGCVLVKNNVIVARGYTNPPGEHHAEAMALSQMEGNLTSVTAFVTLEPCSFYGRTPSCAVALLERGVKEVFVAMLAPDPRNQGQGISLLRNAGVPVSIGLLREEAEKDLSPYLMHVSS